MGKCNVCGLAIQIPQLAVASQKETIAKRAATDPSDRPQSTAATPELDPTTPAAESEEDLFAFLDRVADSPVSFQHKVQRTQMKAGSPQAIEQGLALGMIFFVFVWLMWL